MPLAEIQGGMQRQNGDMMSHDLCPITLTLMMIASTMKLKLYLDVEDA